MYVLYPRELRESLSAEQLWTLSAAYMIADFIRGRGIREFFLRYENGEVSEFERRLVEKLIDIGYLSVEDLDHKKCVYVSTCGERFIKEIFYIFKP